MKRTLLAFAASLFLTAFAAGAADCGSCDRGCRQGAAKPEAGKPESAAASADKSAKPADGAARILPPECAKCEHKDVCKCLGTCPGGVCRNKCKGERKCTDEASSKCPGCRSEAAKPPAAKTDAKPEN